MNWNLMTDNAISKEDRNVLARFIQESDKLTQGPVVKEFEAAWSKWQGCKYSVFVNSGSSANLLIVRALTQENQTWICQASTWITNVSPVIQNNLDLILCDIDLSNFGPKLDMLETLFQENENLVLFLTHFIGIPAISDALLELCSKYNVTLVEDCCESHGAEFNGKKIGNFGIASSFSFYYGHHMTTIEGGMICTDDEEFYHQLLLLRSHGMLRELPADAQDQYLVDGVDPKFTFLRDAYNVRSCDVNATLGLLQLPRMDENIKIRNQNFEAFVSGLDPEKYHCDFVADGVSSFCLPIISKTNNINEVKSKLKSLDIECRPFIGGNLYKHPVFKDQIPRDSSNVEYLNNNCVYVGNHQDVRSGSVAFLVYALNRI